MIRAMQGTLTDTRRHSASLLSGRELERANQEARAGRHLAQLSLASHLLGKGDFISARLWFTRASEVYASAMVQLGLMALNGQGGPLDAEEAARWFLRAANQGSGQGMYNLSVCFQQGKGVEQSDDKALFWMTRASEAGHDMAARICSALDVAKTKAVDEYCARHKIASPQRLQDALSISVCSSVSSNDSLVAASDSHNSSAASDPDASFTDVPPQRHTPRLVARLPGVYFDARRNWDRDAIRLSRSLYCCFLF